MGGGSFDDQAYHQSSVTRASQGISDFDYSSKATEVHATLDPLRINKKKAGILESCDSTEHPESTAIIFTFDVTGSNIDNAVIAQKRLPELMSKLVAVISNPQVAIWANDDARCQGRNSIQISEFESDNRIDEAIRNIWLTGDGGGNGGESYDLLIYAAARKVKTDCFTKRGKKGYMFLYADEPFREIVSKKEVKLIFDDNLEVNIPIGDMIAEAQQKWNIFVLWPRRGYVNAREQYEELFGKDHVIHVEGPDTICDTVASLVASEEEKMKLTAELAVAEAAGDYVNRVE